MKLVQSLSAFAAINRFETARKTYPAGKMCFDAQILSTAAEHTAIVQQIYIEMIELSIYLINVSILEI
jgi:hypothetical protein